MTFSIVARSEDGSHLGVAVASKFLAVGSAVPAAEVSAGAIATQALANLAYRPDGLALLRAGASAGAAVATLTGQDDGRDDRQLGIVDSHGGTASFTGIACVPWAGGRAGTTAGGSAYAVQGNILAGPQVVEAVIETWEKSDARTPFHHRLVQALAAGDLVGGDSRGRQSAAVYVVTPKGGYGGTSDVEVDLRVDDHPDPIPELSRLIAIRDMLFGHVDLDACLPLTGELAEEVQRRLASVGQVGDDVEKSLIIWADIENLEERMVPGQIDPIVLAHLRSLTDGTS
jgi:uncharacterized Ntn-hydrolase superfamily protein